MTLPHTTSKDLNWHNLFGKQPDYTFHSNLTTRNLPLSNFISNLLAKISQVKCAKMFTEAFFIIKTGGKLYYQ